MSKDPLPASGTWPLQSLRNELRSLVCQSTLLFRPVFMLRKQYRGMIVSRETDIVIEGAGGCGNSFAVLAFQFAQGRSIKIAHHPHAPAQVVIAVRWGIPVIVLIRNPLEAVPSILSRHSHLTMRQAIKNYIRFYAAVLPYRRQLALALFEELTSDFGSVIRRTNRRFGTAFVPFEHSPANEQSIYHQLINAKPQPERTKCKYTLKQNLLGASELRPSLDNAMLLYRSLTG